MDPIIRIRDYSFTYYGTSRPAVRDLNIDIQEKEIVLLAGPSGCGKSTVLRSIIGLIPHLYSGVREGFVVVNGLDVAETSITELAKNVGFVFQNPENQIFMFSVERDIAFGLENLGTPRGEIRERVDWALSLLRIQHLARRAPHELSDGQKQRVALAGVIVMKPQVLILDEPTSLLDPRTALELVGLVKQLRDELGITILVVEHRLELLSNVADRIIVMGEGTVHLDGPPRRVLESQEASPLGLGVPAVSKLNILLQEAGLELGVTSTSIAELADRLNGILVD